MILVAQRPFAWWWRRLVRGRAPSAAPTHRFTMQLRHGTSEVVAQPGRGLSVRCKRGRLWITHDGDPKDVVLDPEQSYTPEHDGRMTLHAVADCEMEMSFSA